jgi:hypothetical protein
MNSRPLNARCDNRENVMQAIDYFEEAKRIVREDAAKRLAKTPRRPPIDIEAVVYVTDSTGQEWEISVGLCYEATYDPGIYSGPWENSYPAYGDMDISDVLLLDDLPPGVTERMVMDAADSARDRLEDECWADYHEKTNQGPEE